MLSKELLLQAQNECIEMIGRKFVEANKDNACPCYGEENSGLFRFTLCISDEILKDYRMGNETPFKYCASVQINKEGRIIRDYQNSRLPKQN